MTAGFYGSFGRRGVGVGLILKGFSCGFWEHPHKKTLFPSEIDCYQEMMCANVSAQPTSFILVSWLCGL